MDIGFLCTIIVIVMAGVIWFVGHDISNYVRSKRFRRREAQRPSEWRITFGIEEENGPAEYVLTQLAAELKCSPYQLLPSDRWDSELDRPCGELFVDDGLDDLILYTSMPAVIHRPLTPDEEELLYTGLTLSDLAVHVQQIVNGTWVPQEAHPDCEHVK